MCPLTRSRLLPAARIYNRHFGGYLLAFFHAAYDHQAAARDQQAAMIHGGFGSVLADRFPFAGVVVKCKSHRRRLGRLAAIADSVVVVGGVGSAGKIDPAALFFHRPGSGRNTVVRSAGMGGKSGPPDFRDITFLRTWKLAHPAFAGGDVLGIDASRIFVGAVHINNGVADDGARMTEYWYTGNRCSLHPDIFIGVVYLD